jgi:hypothetical protein
MVVKVKTWAGFVGYRHQLDRARRFLIRVDGPHASDVDFQDMMWAFFQNCWHIRDWVEHDPLLARRTAVRDAVLAAALKSRNLRRCAKLCNGTKHLNPRRNARHSHVNTTIVPGSNQPRELDCLIRLSRGKLVSGKQLAHDCLAEWERILKAQGLAVARLS